MEKINKNEPLPTFYDFQWKHYRLKIFGIYYMVDKPSILRFLNFLYVILVYSLYAFLLVSGALTMVAVSDKRLAVVEAFYALGSILMSINLTGSKLTHLKQLNEAAEMLRCGIHHYDSLEEENNVMRSKAVKKIKSFVTVFVVVFIYLGSSIIFKPLVKLLMSNGEMSNDLISPYLPFPIIVPFDLNTTSGYCLAYFLEAAALTTMYVAYPFVEEMYFSSVIQVASEYDVLCYSLENIERRAYLRLIKMDPERYKNISEQSLYEYQDFQNCLNFCLRENIRHHLAILRLKDRLFPFFEWANLLVMFIVSVLVASGIIMFLEDPKGQFTMIKEIGGFLPLCWGGQIIQNSSSRVKLALYSTPWYKSDRSFRLTLQVCMERVQKPLLFKTKYLNIIMCLETFADTASLAYKVINSIR